MTTEQKPLTVKEMRQKEAQEKSEALRKACEALAVERYTKDQVVLWSNTHGGLFYLPLLDENEQIEKLAILKPINRHTLSYASTKMEDEGLYAFLEVVMRECWLGGDQEIIDDDVYFLPAAGKLNKMIEGKKAAFVKR